VREWEGGLSTEGAQEMQKGSSFVLSFGAPRAARRLTVLPCMICCRNKSAQWGKNFPVGLFVDHFVGE
jgi:hypothetical protein